MSKIPSYQPVLTLSCASITDIPEARFVEYDGRLCRGNYRALGVSEISTLSGEIAPIIAIGTALVLANETINIGAEIASDEFGRAINYTSGTINAIALSSAVAGEYVKVLLKF
ncbi:MAG TPA: DUF2190 family protein [Candidatus Kapabacteria bacterium]|nr:DUF2190 family protein [Candidatus Kapabacteria bacterium]